MESRKLKFVTNNSYRGTWDEQRNCMEGFGVYESQDGMTYRGFFRNGLTHGCGVWELGMPANCSVITTSKQGKIERVHDIVYADGVHIKNTGSINTDLKNWNYCSANDRRYAEEVFRGLSAVGNATEAKHTLKPGEYETMSGIYMKSSGFTIREGLDKMTTSFVACVGERNWIENNYVKGLEPGEHRAVGKSAEMKMLQSNFRALNEHDEQDKKYNLTGCLCEPHENGSTAHLDHSISGSINATSNQFQSSTLGAFHTSVPKSDLQLVDQSASSSLDSFPMNSEKVDFNI